MQDRCSAWAADSVPSSAPGSQTDPVSWLRAMLAALDFFRKGLVRCTLSRARSRLSRKVILAGGVATILPIMECGTPRPTRSRDIWIVVRALSASSLSRSLETECTPILQPRPMYLSFAARKMKAHAEFTFPGRVYDETPVANDPCDVDAILKGAAAGRDLNADNRSVLQSRFQPAVISVSHVTAQFENEPGAGLHAFYLEGTGWLKMRNQHEERSQLEYHSRLEEHRASQNAGRTCPFA